MAFPTVPIGHPDEAGLDLLQSVLDGQSGLLFRDLRDVHGLGYSVTAFNWKTQKAGMMVFYIGTEPGKMEEAEQGFRRIIGELRTTQLEADDINRGKTQMNGDYYRSLQTVRARSSEAATLTLLGLPLDASRKLVDNAQQVNAADLQNLAGKYLQPEKAYIIKVLP
jgi:zinc protease